MSARRLRKAWLCFAVPLPLAVCAQTTSPVGTVSTPEPTVQVGGKTAFDLVRLETSRFSVPLRFGNVMPGSERVELEGRSLTKGKDYAIDYAAGAIFLSVPFRDGQSLRVSYRYDEKKGSTGTFGSAGQSAQGLRFEFAPGASMIVGMGLTERTADGTLLSSNVYGMATNYTLGGGTGKLSGVFLVGDRKRAKVSSLFGNYDTGKGKVEEGQGQAIVQNLSTNALGGKVELQYQDIETKFGGFSSFASAGYTPQQVQQFEKEKGLKRSSLQMSNIGTNALRSNFGVKRVGDDKGTINWRNAGLSAFGLTFGWTSQSVDRGFTRFNDLAEADRGQLAKEKGLTRQNYTIGSKWKVGKLDFSGLKVENDDGTGIYRQNLGLELPWFKVGYFDQHVEKGFKRFGDLREQDWQQLAKEAGIIRQGFSAETNLIGRAPLRWQKSTVRTDTGDLKAQELSYTSKNFSFEHIRRETDPGFRAFGSMTEADIQSQLTGIMRMYDPAGPVQGQDRNWFAQMAGLTRTSWRTNWNFAKGSQIRYEQLDVLSETGRIDVDTLALKTPKFDLGYRLQSSSDDFKESGRLLLSEQQRLGTADGFNKADLSLTVRGGKNQSVEFNRMAADDKKGSVGRMTLRWNDPRLQVHYIRRFASEDFRSLDSLVDAERDLYRGILGFDQSDVLAKWQVLPGLKVDFHRVDSVDSIRQLTRHWQNAAVDWQIGKNFTVGMLRHENNSTDFDDRLIDTRYDRYTMSHNFGRFGRLSLMHEEHEFAGVNEDLPDAKRQTVVYETQINAKTGFRTEQSETKYENGERETTSSNTISTELNKRVGVSVTDSRTLRDGDKKDETKRFYGFWLDFGKGIKLKYNYARHLDGEKDGTKNTETTITPGEAGGVKIDQATYVHNSWQGKRDQHFGNVSVANAKPFDWGWMKDVRFHYKVDTVRDFTKWQRENRSFGFGGSLGHVGFSFDYASQMHQNGHRAIDRTFAFTTDKTGKAPIRAGLRYGVRTMPDNKNVMIRDYSVVFQPNKNWSLGHSMTTNALQNNPNVLLGSVPVDERKNSWVLKYQNDPRTIFDLSWNEIQRDNKKESMYREARANLTLFANNPSPLQLSYGVLQWDRNNQRQTAHKFGISFTQRPGPNQSLSFMFENLNWEHSRPKDSRLQNWSMRLDYSVKF